MNRNPSMIEGLGLALLSAVLITAGLSLTNIGKQEQKAINTETITSLPTLITPATSSPPSATPRQPTKAFTPTACPQPRGWEPYTMRSGDLLETLARERLVDVADVVRENCLTRPGALPGSVIYLPPKPSTLTPTFTQTATITMTPTVTLRPCDYPIGWERYTINTGDSFFKLGVRFLISEVDLATGNCLSMNANLRPGDVILVPVLPTVTPTP